MRGPVVPGLPDPLGLFSPLMRGLGGLDAVEQVRRGMWIYASTPRPPVGTTPHAVVFAQNKLVVRYYAPQAADARRTPVVLVPSLINRAYILDLEPDRSLCAGLARLGHPVYLVDWGVPGPEDADHDVAHVVLTLLHRSMDRILRHARQPRALVLGYCQGGTLSAMYAALRPERVAGLVALNAPVRFSEAGRFRRFVDPATFDVERSIRPDGLVNTDVMELAFKLLDPMGNWTKYRAIDAAAKDPVQLGRAMARERWLEENVPMPGAFAREFIRCAYQEDRLVAGGWSLRGEAVSLAAVEAPLLVVACSRDTISPPGACLPLVELAGSARKRSVVLDAGHIGVVVGGMGPKVFYPMLDRWIREEAAC